MKPILGGNSASGGAGISGLGIDAERARRPRAMRPTSLKFLISSMLARLMRKGELVVTWPDGTATQFSGSAGPRAGMELTTWTTVQRVAFHPGLALGEAYMDETLKPTHGSLFDLLDVLMMNAHAGVDHPVWRLRAAARKMTRRLRQINGATQARHHVAHHYDLDGRLYSRFLDSDMQYSCAYFARGDETLEEAQDAKKHLIAAKLYLDRPGLTVLDIGCGWGGMALTLASDYGARVTGITLSAEQLAYARAGAAAANLSDRVQFEMADYRSIRHRFDRVVSVGMMEHVGLANYDRYFNVVRDCLAADGVALIHHIGRSDGPGTTAAWLQKYIFPGGYAPALSEVVPSIERSGLIMTDIETLRLHYARTLELWRERFRANRDEIARIYDARFCRMFEFYLVGAELAFRREGEVVYQIQLSPNQATLPLNRRYIVDDQRGPARRAARMVGETVQPVAAE